jgi:hypothetical protein
MPFVHDELATAYLSVCTMYWLHSGVQNVPAMDTYCQN